MGKCVVKDCNSRSQKHTKENGITFHTVPKDPERSKKWTHIIRLLRKETDWLPSKTTVICSKHFRNQDKMELNTGSGRVYLTSAAVPILNEDFNFEVPLVSHLSDSRDVDDDSECDEEINEITESIQMNNLRKTINRLRFVATNRLKKIKSLSDKNRRLAAKNKQLNEIIVNLKKKFLKDDEESC